ncbi:MAG TPA: transglutaminase family protein [Amaricoccus sp.]|uniref:transglutaminase family protein n=1 Tax=Amaricoccus sp. TaxID=1872485 RepID=UPI002CE3E93C|nr:transglutaminase family protein [Amaricoccus sp.]HMQ93316.1 transglutaminase family protein [Amaricoccus sp.]HMR53085.1 transglutaminase family protein [Amaricoccus sp.]HMR60367.1 transglutaminase family protein [Amaricoccus sp.]HMT99962.1 transglutaminase family protein [Amaricoccus sp.]
MRLSVRHTTIYRFDAPMRFVTQSHRLTPSTCASQRIVAWEVGAEGAVFGASFVDGAGDRVTTMTVEGPVERIDVTVTGEVETIDAAGVLRGHREIISPRTYLRPTQRTKANGALGELAAEALAAAGEEGDLGRAHLLAAAVAEAIAYAPGTTEAHTTAAEALEQGRGVCQDHAHAMIALAQSVGMPARYVTGYLLTGGEEGMGEASHAWAELHVEGLGWVGFDPANRCCPDDRYIRLGSGRDALDAAPIRGVSRGGGTEAMDVTVVVAAQQ